MSWGRRWGAVQSLQLAKASNPTASHAEKKPPLRIIQISKRPTESPRRGAFLLQVQGLHSGNLPTDCLQAHNEKRAHYYFHSNEPLSVLVPER